jgi:hypothetical protein
LSNNLDEYNIDEDSYLGLDEENLYSKAKHKQKQEIYGNRREW